MREEIEQLLRWVKGEAVFSLSRANDFPAAFNFYLGERTGFERVAKQIESILADLPPENGSQTL